MEQRTLLKGFAKLFGKSTEDRRNISASKAISLQQEYIAEAGETGEICQQTYMTILPQVDDKREEISSAALFYLEKISSNFPQYAEDIVHLLEERQKKNRLNEVKAQRFAQTIAVIRKNIP